jgi:ABC-type lipoprotein export system ATPase subunit
MHMDLTPIDERDDEELEAIPEQAKQTELAPTLSGKPATIAAEGLSKTFTYQGGQVRAVDGSDCTVGQFITIVGPSGSGKSTLLYLLGGLDRPTSGTLHVAGVEVGELSEWQEHQFRRGRVGFVFQSYHLLPGLTARENVMVPMRLAGGQSWEQMRAQASELLVTVGISADRHHHKPGKLSGGQQQRVAIARALANDPKVILADEPTGDLDALNSRRIIDLLKNLAEQGKTVIVVTHDRTIAKSADVCLELSDGRLKRTENSLAAPARVLAPSRKHKGKKK